MNASSLSAFRGYIEAQGHRGRKKGRIALPVLTLSREAGAGAVTIGRLVAEQLNRQHRRASDPPWTIFDRNLVERVLEDHDLPAQIRQFMPEDTPFGLKDAVEELVGLHPSNWTLVQHTTDTIQRLARLGNVILVGRGAHVITARLPLAFHVRLVAPLEQRIAHAAAYYNLTQKDAADLVRKTDQARRRYVKHHLGERIDDPLQYHLTINTDRISHEAAAHLIIAGLFGDAETSQRTAGNR